MFNKNERTKDEAEVHDYVRTILQWRKNAVEIYKGQLKHYKPTNKSIYVYFRTFQDRETMIILNNGEDDVSDFSLRHYKESLDGYSKGVDILTQEKYNSFKKLALKANTAYIIELKH